MGCLFYTGIFWRGVWPQDENPIFDLPKKEGGFLIIDVNHVDGVEYLFEKGIYFYVSYCLYFVNEISTDMLEDKSMEEGGSNL